MDLKNDKAMRFLELISSVTRKEYELFIDFENRYEHQYTIRNRLINIVLNTKMLRKKKDVELKNEILKNVQLVQAIIQNSFRAVLEYQNEDREKLIELLRQEETPFAQEKLFLETEFNRLRNDIMDAPAEETEAKKKARNMMKEYKDLLMKQGILSDADEHLEELLRKLPTILINQQRLLQKAMDILPAFDKLKGKNYVVDEDLPGMEQMKQLNDIANKLYEQQRKEKEEFVNPFSNYIKIKKKTAERVEEIIRKKQKRGILAKIRGLWHKDLITLEDVTKDIRHFTEPVRVKKYLFMLREYPDLLDEPTKRFIKKAYYLSDEDVQKRLVEAKLADYDMLTGLYNRKFFDKKLNEEIRKKQESLKYTEEHRKGKAAEENHLDFSLIMIDADFFKSVNDEYGHSEGDRALKYIAEQINDTTKRRDTDFSCRYGGEEFVVLLEETDLKGALKVAEDIRKNIEIAFEFNKGKREVTVSAGVASSETADPDDVLKKADEALYKAKEHGRNQAWGYFGGEDFRKA